jgi:hypothetical protein
MKGDKAITMAHLLFPNFVIFNAQNEKLIFEETQL